MPNDDLNPFPNDIPKKKPPHEEAGKEWKWETSDEDKGINPSTKSEFDNENIWYEEGYTDEDNKRSYEGKHTEHEYPHISIHGKSGTLKAKHGYMYRLFDCSITELTIEGTAIIYCRDCKIDKLTGSASEGYARVHFTNCEIKDVKDVSKCKMIFDRETEFKDPSGSAQFNSLDDCAVSIFSKPEWSLSNAKHMSGLSDCDITVSGPSCIHQNSGQAMIEGLSNCNFSAMGQWLATGAKSGCTQDQGNKIFSGVSESNILTVNTKINNPDVGGALCEGLTKSTFTSIDPEFVIHAVGYAGSKSHTAHIGGKYENCDVIHFHITDGSNCCVNTKLTGSPGVGSMLQTGASDRSSLVVAGGKLDVEDNAAPVFQATDCSMRFYDCETVKQKGSQDLFANDENCISRVVHCEEVKSLIKKVWNEKKKCRADAVDNKLIEAVVDDCIVMGEDCVMTAKYNKEIKAKKKTFKLTKAALSTERNEKITAIDEEAIVATSECNISLNQDEEFKSENAQIVMSFSDKCKVKSRKGNHIGDSSLYCWSISGDTTFFSEFDHLESEHHAILMSSSKMDMRYPDIDVKHDGYHGSKSFIDCLGGKIKCKGEEFSLGNCEGSIKSTLLNGEKTLEFTGKNSFYCYDLITKYINMAAKDDIECEKMTNLNDITGAGCIFKVRFGSCNGNIAVGGEEVWFHKLDVLGATTIDANICKLFGSNFKALAVTGGNLQTGGNTALGTVYAADLGTLSNDTYTALACSGNYIMNNVSGGSIGIDGLAFYQNCPDILSLPYKKGIYSSDDLDVYAVNNIKMWALGGKVEIQAAMNIESLAGMSIKETAGMSIEEVAAGTSTTTASRIIHN